MKEKCNKIIEWRYEYEEMPEDVEAKFNLITCVALTCIFMKNVASAKTRTNALKEFCEKK